MPYAGDLGQGKRNRNLLVKLAKVNLEANCGVGDSNPQGQIPRPHPPLLLGEREKLGIGVFPEKKGKKLLSMNFETQERYVAILGGKGWIGSKVPSGLVRSR
ncbi:hypothetical protein KZX47_12990 [Thermus sp. SYSU G05001]|uniref:Uncharacterized protein n=1 Tax=Thermus brevis TaxID=2862456 RepID=A0ABS7A1W1_9DEIN|nr:hypothetical protein [Thermus brevis]MBW6396060.1 hypothetical protein [Thermus brevis]